MEKHRGFGEKQHFKSFEYCLGGGFLFLACTIELLSLVMCIRHKMQQLNSDPYRHSFLERALDLSLLVPKMMLQ